MVVVDGWLAEGTPHALERAGVGVEHNDAMVAIAVGDIELVALRVYPHVCRPVQVCGVGIALALVAVADLHDELAVLGELQELIVGYRLEARQAVGRAAVAADPDEALVVDMNAVLALRPFVAGAVAAPGLDVVAGLVEHHDGWRCHREVGVLEGARTVQEPDIVLRVDRKARRVAELPFGRHLRPGGIDLEHRQASWRLRLRGGPPYEPSSCYSGRHG